MTGSATDRPVLVDTSAWIDHDHGRGLAPLVEELVRSRRALVTAPVVAELLRGAKTVTGRARYRSLVGIFPVVEPRLEDWIRAGEVAADFDRRGTRIPMIDFLLAALAARLGSSILTSDPHFQTIAAATGATLYRTV
ncbi:MAG: PIN domain-containing protein [Nitrospirae bacterium]|nr:PIN domain-containing protein [Nitrospirota bacterium]